MHWIKCINLNANRPNVCEQGAFFNKPCLHRKDACLGLDKKRMTYFKVEYDVSITTD